MPVTIGGGLSFCGQPLTPEQIELIRQLTRDFRQLPLSELAHTVCELLEWKRPKGSLKSRECYLFLQALQQRGWLPWLPAPRRYTRRPHQTSVGEQSNPQAPCTGSLARWLPIQVELIDTPADRKLFEQYIHRYHYLGYRVPYGAQLRYFVSSRQPPYPRLACLLFTSAAWKMAPREDYIGWSEAARRSNLSRVVNNSRFLILPWVEIANLASHILSAAAARLGSDWTAHYAAEAVLLETLVDRSRYLGTCYRAANWISVGFTQGRGRMDRWGKGQGERKEIFLYPLKRDWRRQLCDGASGPVSNGSERGNATTAVAGDV
jgi:hypothetical protein